MGRRQNWRGTKMKLFEKIILISASMASLVLTVVIFITMRNEHHETRDLLSLLAAPVEQPLGSELAMRRQEVPCPSARSRTMVLLAAGQSNASNYGGFLNRSMHGAHVVEFYQNRCYVAEDPTISGDGWGGTPWVDLGNRLIESGNYDDVVIAVAAKGGSSIGEWRNGHALNARLADIGFALSNANLPATIIAWVQGEADRSAASYFHHTSHYSSALAEVIATTRRFASESRFLVTLDSSCPLDPGGGLPELSIRRAQIAASDPDHGVTVGPDLDAINAPGDRYDVCHLSSQGLQKFVEQWVAILAPVGGQASIR